MYVITYQGTVGSVVIADDIPVGWYLAVFDPDAYEGRGHSQWTDQLALAIQFETFEAAFETWRVTSSIRPTRDDGKPNRPLTAFNIEIKPI